MTKQISLSDPASLVKLAIFNHQNGNLQESARILRRAIGIVPPYPPAFDVFAAVLVELKQFAPAVTAARRAVALDPSNWTFVRTLAIALTLQGERESAIQTVEAACAQMSSPSPELVLLLARLLAISGRIEQALTLFDSLLDADPTNEALKGERIDIYGKLTTDVSERRSSGEAFAVATTGHLVQDNGRSLFWFNTPPPAKESPRFLVLTSGNCGAIWFTSALNMHPAILANCGIDHPIESFFHYPMKKDGSRFLRAAKPEHFQFGVRPEVMGPILAEHGLTLSLNQRLYHRLGWFVFDELESLPLAAAHRVVGSVHAFSATEFLGYYRRDPAILGGRRVVTANMIRHPLTRHESNIKAFLDYRPEHIRILAQRLMDSNPNEYKLLERKYKVDLSDLRTQAVIVSFRYYNVPGHLSNEIISFSSMIALKMEDLQSDRDYFSMAFSVLTRKKLKVDHCYLDEVFDPYNLGLGRRGPTPQGTRPPSAERQWEMWSDFERDEFVRCCRANGIIEAYQPYGYDFSFMR